MDSVNAYHAPLFAYSAFAATVPRSRKGLNTHSRWKANFYYYKCCYTSLICFFMLVFALFWSLGMYFILA